jgi:ComF family protein
VHYDKRAKVVLKEAKYHFAYKVLFEIAGLMKPVYSNLPFAVDYIVPVPLSTQRQNWRGFNQSKILAQKLNWQVKEFLQKSKHTTAQARLHRSDRLKNPGESFSLVKNANVKGKTIILVDDVYTTGATLQECAKVLKQNGAGKVFAMVWAKD